MKLAKDQITSFQTYIFTWWQTNQRDLPWRKTRDPYKILISEVMLQQTQVTRVLPKYLEFIRHFPSVESLAKASTAEVLGLWKGMGYNRRALYLKRTAETVVDTYEGVFPQTEKELLALPGLGKYTANAILVFAFEQQRAFIDTNIRHIVIHHFFHDQPQPEKEIEEAAVQLLPEGKAWEWHQALMDYGALVLSSDVRNHRRSNLLKEKSVGYISQSKLPFKQTNRFFRGKIMDLLRVRSWDKTLLIDEMIAVHGRDRTFMEEILRKLESDGLITIHNQFISLPT